MVVLLVVFQLRYSIRPFVVCSGHSGEEYHSGYSCLFPEKTRCGCCFPDRAQLAAGPIMFQLASAAPMNAVCSCFAIRLINEGTFGPV